MALILLLSLLAVSGLAAANGITGNMISGVPEETMNIGGYALSILSIGAIFLIIATNTQEEEMY